MRMDIYETDSGSFLSVFVFLKLFTVRRVG